jgi:tRNA nucleotidyltransferase (CCA-adding enzyme)
MKMQDVLTLKLKDIDVSLKELKKLRELAMGVVSELKKKKIDAFIGGSLAKGTVVKKEMPDVDIFVVFDEEKEISKLERALSSFKLPGVLKKVHGSRDYFQILTKDVKLELIPVVKNVDPEEATNVTDVSLSHVKYVVGAIKKDKKLANEIKLAKAFCQAQKCYGAESYIKGFSGYSLEVLVIYFGSFVNFLKNVGRRKVVDPKKYFKNEKQVLFELNSSKLQGPLVVVDPTYKYRNVTAGLSEETFKEFLETVKKFLKKPSLEFFEYSKTDLNELKSFAVKNKAKLFEVDLETDRQEGDIAGTKCKKFFDFFVKELNRNGQEVLRKEFFYVGEGVKAKGYLVVKVKSIVEVRGPPVSLKKSVEGFKKEHAKTYVKKGVLWAKKEVSIVEVFDFANRVKDEMGSWGKNIKIL